MRGYELSRVVLALVLLGALSSCVPGVDESERVAYTLTYRVSWGAPLRVSQIQYLDGQLRTVLAPEGSSWTKGVRAAPGDGVYLSALASGDGSPLHLHFEVREGGAVVASGEERCESPSCELKATLRQ
jgi:hypothetical protein